MQLNLLKAKLATAAPESRLQAAGACLQEAAAARQALAEATSELQALQGIAEQRNCLQRGLEAALAERIGLQDQLQSLQQCSEAGLQQVTAERNALQEQLSSVSAERDQQGPKVSASQPAHSQLATLIIWNNSHAGADGPCHVRVAPRSGHAHLLSSVCPVLAPVVHFQSKAVALHVREGWQRVRGGNCPACGRLPYG